MLLQLISVGPVQESHCWFSHGAAHIFVIIFQHGNTALHVTALQREACHVGDLMTCGVDPAIRNKVPCLSSCDLNEQLI